MVNQLLGKAFGCWLLAFSPRFLTIGLDLVDQKKMVIRCNSAVSRLVVLFIGLSIFPASSWAQTDETTRYTLVLRNTSIEEALEELVSLTKINLVYDPKLLTDAAIFCNAKDETAEKILSCITQGANLDFYRLSSGTYVLTEPPQEEPRFGALAGIVVDAETGTPLPYANVLLADASTGTATNSAGMFAFASLLSGPHAIVTTYLGYETALDSVWIPPDGDARQYIELTPAPVVSAPIIVNGLQQRLPSRDLGSGRLDPADFQRPGNSGAADVVYSLNSVMNVGLRAPFVDLHIQGGETNENIMLLDGVPVFEPVSLGRMLGAFSPLAIDRITVYKAGFGAGVGSQLSGVLSAEQRLSAAPRDRLTFLIDPLSVNGRVNASFELPGPANAQFMLAGRSSVWDLYQSDVLASMLEEWNAVDGLLTSTVLGAPTDALAFTPHRHGSDVRFSDIHAAGQIQLDAYKKLSFSFYQGKNEIASELLTSEALQGAAFIMLSRDRYAWNNSTAQMRYEWLMGARALGVMRIRNSTHNLSHNYQFQDTPSADLPAGLDVPEIERRLGEIMDASGSPDDKNRLRETAFETFIDYSFAKDHHLAAGLEIIQSSSRFSLDNPFFVPLDLEYADWRVSGFMEDRISIGLQTSIEAGARLTYVPDRKTMYAEPRLAFRYDVSQSSVGPYSIHLATGIYRQYVNPFDLSNPGPSAAVPYLRFWLPIDETLGAADSLSLHGQRACKPIAILEVSPGDVLQGDAANRGTGLSCVAHKWRHR